VIGADGRIAWSDNSARLKHQIASFGADLDSAIESALAVGSRQRAVGRGQQAEGSRQRAVGRGQ
jgi:hypothetical protein